MEETRLRVIHAAPDAPPVDIYIRGEDTPRFANLAYGEVSTAERIEPGAYVLDVRPAGADPALEPLLSSEPITVNLNVQVTAIVAGLIEGVGEDAVRIISVAEEFDAIAAGEARVRVVNVGADLPPLAVDIDRDQVFEFEDVQRFGASDPAGFVVPAARPTPIGVHRQEAPREVITGFTVPELAPRERVLIILIGVEADRPREPTGLQVIAAGRDERLALVQQDPAVMVLHAVSDAGAVDLRADGEAMITDLRFGEVAGPIFLPAGTFTVDLFAAGVPDVPVGSGTLPDLVAGERYFVIAAGAIMITPPDIRPFDLITVRDDFDATIDEAQLQFIHASPDAPVVDLGPVDQGAIVQPPIVAGLEFGEASEIVRVAPEVERIVVGVAPLGTVAPVITFTVETTPGLAAWGVIAGSAAPRPAEEPLTLLVVDSARFPWEATGPAVP